MDNTKCILVEFSNDQKVATGYLSWLNEKDQADLDDIISTGKEVIISWPDCDVVSNVKLMAKRLREVVVNKYAARILNHGRK